MNGNNNLKLSSNAVVDNLYLVNLVHNPNPILIENKSTNSNLNEIYRGRLDNTKFKLSSNNNFEFIDEEKLSIYSYLIQRDLKTKEYLNKFELDQFEKASSSSTAAAASVQTNRFNNKEILINKETKSQSSIKSTSTNTLSNKSSHQPDSTPGNPQPIKNPTQSNAKSSHDIVELKKCCNDSVKAIENLENQLNQYKHERLKIAFNDPQEEEKQKRILLEQIKYLLRSSYNLQNQINRLKLQFEQNKLDDKSSKMSPASRLTHTMRQVIKTINIFSDLYPYRPNNDATTEKLCMRFYKQLQMSIENFSNCLSLLSKLAKSNEFNSDTTIPIVNELNTKLDNCNKYFEDIAILNDIDAVVKPQLANLKVVKKEKSKQKLNIIRAPRKAPLIKKKVKTVKKSNSNENIQQMVSSTANMRFEIPISNKRVDKPVYEKKTIQTAKLFPSKRSGSNSSLTKKINESINASSVESLKINENIKPKNLHFKSSSQYNLTNTETTKSADSFYSPAFVHLSSPKLSRIGFEKNRKSPRFRSSSANSNSSNQMTRHVSKSPTGLKSNESFFNDELSQSMSELKMKHANDLEQMRANFQTGKQLKTILLNRESLLERIDYPKLKRPDVLFTRLDNMKKENDDIRKKYEKLNYEETLMKKYSYGNQARHRPYEECYISNDDALITKQYEPLIDVNTLYRQVNRPRVDQMSRVLDYAKKFADYSQKTSVTIIGESKFNDFELFESLSEDLFDEIISDVVDELEDVNQEITSHLINNELVLKNDNDIK